MSKRREIHNIRGPDFPLPAYSVAFSVMERKASLVPLFKHVLNVCLQMADIASHGMHENGGITIRDAHMAPADEPAAPLDAKIEADIEFARQLQAKLDAEEARGGNRCGPSMLTR